ncbi:hypothetical protein FHR24_003084 [Wenyingzhuangia heitensis]|uniref:DUF4276 family protein n=1 Tax=Wenyingzhuangia heitensis TaxID=1487859 RepID=A0ABX0UCN3_9FLAO|nr:DUF3226 domain-containing protein [Wenyingzhuangia heitensis]NIJ46594.1 hypothetical protein [Wenyingzhuangia heitensis]
MTSIKIFVEGIADEKFIIDYLKNEYNYSIEKNGIIITNGWDSINSKEGSEAIINEMNKNSDNDGVNLLIFDSDNDFTQRKDDLTNWKTGKKVNFELFLWPNNKDNGDFEILLENIINPINKPILDCWDNYENCLKQKQIPNRSAPLTTPARKTKVYAYLEALLGESKSQKKKIKEINRNYNEVEHWDLNSQYMNSFKSFLDTYFKR